MERMMHPQKLLKKVGQGDLEVRDLTKRELRDLHSMLRTVGPHMFDRERIRELKQKNREEMKRRDMLLRKFLKRKND